MDNERKTFLSIDTGDDKKEGGAEQPDKNTPEQKGEDDELSIEDKIVKLKETAAHRVEETQNKLNEIIKATDGWDAEDQPEHRQKLRRSIINTLKRGVDWACKYDGLVIAHDTHYKEMSEVFRVIKERIARINALEGQSDEKSQLIIEALAKAAWTPSRDLLFARAGREGSPRFSWEELAKR